MALDILTIAPTTALTTVERVRESGLAFPSNDDADIARIINSVSAAIVNYCGRTFAREELRETCPGFGGIHLALTRTPIAEVIVITVDDSETLVTDHSIADADRGLLYRRGGWGWTVQHYGGLAAAAGSGFSDGFLFRHGTPLPQQEEPLYSVDYVAGYILPPQYLEDVDTLSVDASDFSFNDSGAGFPELVRGNDVVETWGFSNAANNGRFKISTATAPTASKIVVDSTALVTEAAAAGRTLVFHPPAQCRPFDEVERAAFEGTKSWYSGRGRDSGIVERQMSSTRVRWSESEAARLIGLPPSCVGLLRAWRRPA
jgi:hypothetical protein